MMSLIPLEWDEAEKDNTFYYSEFVLQQSQNKHFTGTGLISRAFFIIYNSAPVHINTLRAKILNSGHKSQKKMIKIIF
jgi:hypothetical protein